MCLVRDIKLTIVVWVNSMFLAWSALSKCGLHLKFVIVHEFNTGSVFFA